MRSSFAKQYCPKNIGLGMSVCFVMFAAFCLIYIFLKNVSAQSAQKHMGTYGDHPRLILDHF